jgi:two-component system torCAD operon response regulator TorR
MRRPYTDHAADQDAAAPIRVILVEDDNVLRQGLTDYLRLSGFAVTDVSSGLALYKTLRSEAFDVAILDVNLPDTSGFELARDLRTEQALGIIILTARSGRQDRLQAYEEGADIFLTKPTDGAELALATRNLAARVRQQRAPVEPPSPAGEEPWQLQLRQRRLVNPDGGGIALTPREGVLLEMLADAGGAVVSRARIEEVLGYGDKLPNSRGLDAMLQRLRMKAQASGIELPIQIVHAIGLRCISPLRKN